MAQHNETGKAGEAHAESYLKGIGYRILERNHRKPWGEIDLIALAPDATLVFVEVKTMSAGAGDLRPEHNMTRFKTMKTRRASLHYANANEALAKRGWRIDLVAIEFSGDKAEVRHYENI